MNFKKLITLSIMLVLIYSCQAQIDTSKLHFTSSELATSFYSSPDSCWWTKKTDTIQTDFIITVDENNFIKKQKTDFIVHHYEIKDCLYSVRGLWLQNTRNDIYLADGKSVEILLYRPKGNNILIGNSK